MMKIYDKNKQLIFDGTDFSGVDLRGANLSAADLSGADLSRANLRNANLRGANLRNANLRDADLRYADLSRANLSGANLWNANLGSTAIQINGSKHFLFYFDGNITIGCESHSVEYWKIMYERIGLDYDYTDEQIKEYKKYIYNIDEGG